MSEQEQHRTAAGETPRPAARPPSGEPSPNGTGQTNAGLTDNGAPPGGADGTGELRAQLADMEDRWRRALADFDNLPKRVARGSAPYGSDERSLRPAAVIVAKGI
jgi:molecular chaperone GrpE